MQQFAFKCHPALNTIISSISIMNADFTTSGHLSSYHYPWSAQVRLCFYIHGDRVGVKRNADETFSLLSSIFVVGPQLTDTYLDFGKGAITAAVSFRPGGLQRLLGISIAELNNREVEASVLFGSEILLVERQLSDALTPEAQADILQQFLLKRLSRAGAILPFDGAINELVRYNGNISVEKAAALSCLSKRQFERKCIEKLGMSPKLFARLVRFSKAYMYREGHQQLPWIKIAYEFGYHDQMHLIHDFKQFTGYSPSFIDKDLPDSLKLVRLFEHAH